MEDLEECDNFIVIGSSHAYRLVAAQKEAGESVHSLASPFWRLTEDNVNTTSAAVIEAVKQNPHATVILQLFDSSIYFSSATTGELSLPKRGDDGQYHVTGELVLAEWSAFKKIFNMSAPLIRAAGSCCKILLSPLPRYAMARCCGEEQHLTNFDRDGLNPGGYLRMDGRLGPREKDLEPRVNLPQQRHQNWTQ